MSTIIQLHSLEDQAVFCIGELVRVVLALGISQKNPKQPFFSMGDEHACGWKIGALIERDQFLKGIDGRMIALLEAPLHHAIRRAIRDAGEALHNHTGDISLMRAVLDRVEDQFDEPDGSRAAVIIDHAFDGIGNWVS
jgi:hypothetical protein